MSVCELSSVVEYARIDRDFWIHASSQCHADETISTSLQKHSASSREVVQVGQVFQLHQSWSLPGVPQFLKNLRIGTTIATGGGRHKLWTSHTCLSPTVAVVEYHLSFHRASQAQVQDTRNLSRCNFSDRYSSTIPPQAGFLEVILGPRTGQTFLLTCV